MESVPPLSASLPIPILALRPQDSSTNSMDRGGSSLPVEVWEHIIDLMDSHPRPGHLAWIQWDHLSDVDTTHFCYRMSALTCHAWLRQSRHNLYRVVKFGTREQFDLFLRTITNHPSESLACLVQCLVIPNRWGGSYIPYACDTLVTKLCNLRCLCYYRDSHSSESTAQSAPAWSTGYPLRYNILIARFPIVELTIQSWRSDSTRPESIINIFRLIWSLRDLQVLSLHVPWMHPEAEAEVSRRLRALYRQTICAKLRTLTLLGDGRFRSVQQLSDPIHPYGQSVNKFATCIPNHTSRPGLNLKAVSGSSFNFPVPSFQALEVVEINITDVNDMYESDTDAYGEPTHKSAAPPTSGIASRPRVLVPKSMAYRTGLILRGIHVDSEVSLRRIAFIVDAIHITSFCQRSMMEVLAEQTKRFKQVRSIDVLIMDMHPLPGANPWWRRSLTHSNRWLAGTTDLTLNTEVVRNYTSDVRSASEQQSKSSAETWDLIKRSDPHRPNSKQADGETESWQGATRTLSVDFWDLVDKNKPR